MKDQRHNPLLIELTYWPSLSVAALITNHNRVNFNLDGRFIKASHRNRCQIAGPNGKLILSVPLRKFNLNTPYQNIEIAYDEAWRRQHLRTIQNSYKKAAFYEYYETDISDIYSKKYQFLWELNMAILHMLKSWKVITSDFNVLNKETTKEDFVFSNYEGQHKKFQALEGFQQPNYFQLFGSKNPFIHNAAVLDLLMSEGPQTQSILKNAFQINCG